jgi:uncharacterized RDD family membrane protein YckC
VSSPDQPNGAARHAGLVSRGLGAVIDMLVVLVIMTGLYLGLVLTRLVLNPTAFRFPDVNVIFSTAVTVVVSVVYLAGCWTVSGCTAGAVTMGLRVVGRRSPRLGPAVALLRAFACVLFPVGLIWVALDRQRRSLPDIVLGSRVIYLRHATVPKP